MYVHLTYNDENGRKRTTWALIPHDGREHPADQPYEVVTRDGVRTGDRVVFRPETLRMKVVTTFESGRKTTTRYLLPSDIGMAQEAGLNEHYGELEVI